MCPSIGHLSGNQTPDPGENGEVVKHYNKSISDSTNRQ